MSSADEHIQSDSEVSHDEDSAVEDSETSPSHPSTSNGPKPGMTNGNRTPTKRPAPRTPTSDDRDDSPTLRLLLSSPGPVNLPAVITSPLQPSTSRAVFIPPGTSSTDAGSASVPGASTSTASVIPGDAAGTSNIDAGSAPVPGASTSTASVIPEAGEISATDVGSAPVSVTGIAPAPEASTSIIPGAGEISGIDVGNAPATIPVPENAGESVLAPEDVLRASTSSASNNPEAGKISEAEENVAVEIPLPLVGATDRGIVSKAEGSEIPEITPESVAASNPGVQQLEGIPEIKPAPEVKEGNVPGAIPSAEAASSNVLASEVVQDNTPESMPIVATGSCVPETGAEAARSPDLKTVPFKEVVAPADLQASESMEASIPEAAQNIDADVPETLQSTVTHATSATLPSDAEKASKDEHVSKVVVEASIAEKSDQLSEPTETMEIAEPDKCTTAQKESSQTTGECAQTSEQTPVAEKESQALELAEESKETSNTKKSEATAVESGQASKLTVESSQSSELKPKTSEKYSQIRARLEAKPIFDPATISSGSGQTSEITVEASQSSESKPKTSEKYSILRARLEAKQVLDPATISSGSGQTLKPSEETREAPKPTEVVIEASKPTEVAIEASKPTEVAIEVSKPTEEAGEVSKPQKSTATVGESSLVTEPDEEPMDTSEPSESDPTPESKLEPGKVDAKSAKRSPNKRPAGEQIEDPKSEEKEAVMTPNTYRRSKRIEALKPSAAQRTHSESPNPKKERRSSRSATLERVPSDERLGVRTRSRRVGSASSNSEMEGSGDEVKPKRVSRKDSKK